MWVDRPGDQSAGGTLQQTNPESHFPAAKSLKVGITFISGVTVAVLGHRCQHISNEIHQTLFLLVTVTLEDVCQISSVFQLLLRLPQSPSHLSELCLTLGRLFISTVSRLQCREKS